MRFTILFSAYYNLFMLFKKKKKQIVPLKTIYRFDRTVIVLTLYDQIMNE